MEKNKQQNKQAKEYTKYESVEAKTVNLSDSSYTHDSYLVICVAKTVHLFNSIIHNYDS